MFCKNLKKRGRKAAKKKKKREAKAAMSRHQKNNVAATYGECHANYYNVATLVEVDRSEFSNVATSPQHRLRHHSRLQHQKSNVATSGKDCKSIYQQCHDIATTLVATSAKA